MSKESSKKKSGFRTTTGPVPSEKTQGQESEGKASVEPADKLKFEDLGSLPTGYGEMFLIARDPHWLFTYWDFDYAKFPSPRKLFIQVYRNNELESVVEINEIARNWYIPVQSAGSEYSVVFGYRDANDVWAIVSKAGPTQTPPESISPNWDTQFATVPFHLSFNFLLDVVSAARSEGQPLTETLARLQQAAIGGESGPSSWGGEQVKVLETLLGKDFLDRLFSMSSQDVLQFLHSELSGRLDSESASELLAKGRLASLLAPGESSLFSSSIREFLQQEVSSGGVSSFGNVEVGGASSQLGGLSSQVGGASSQLGELSSEVLAGGSETLASWQAGVRAIISNWEQSLSLIGAWERSNGELARRSGARLPLVSQVTITSYGLSSETLASWQAGVTEIFAKWESVLSSYGVSSEMLASWQAGFREITSSWETLLSSYSLSSEMLSSWETAFGSYNVSSFSFGSEQLSSWNLSSWSRFGVRPFKLERFRIRPFKLERLGVQPFKLGRVGFRKQPVQRDRSKLERAAFRPVRARIFHARERRGDFLRRHRSAGKGHDCGETRSTPTRWNVPVPFQISGQRF